MKNTSNKLNITYRNALAEIEYIINHLPQEDLDKIPNKFKDFITKEKNKQYAVTINMDIPLNKQNLLTETRSILAIIYKLYLAADSEKEKLDELSKLKRGN